MIPGQLLWILVGAFFSAISTLVLSIHREYRQSIRARRVIFNEMESMEDLLNSLKDEENDSRPVRIQIEQQVSTKMYEQHLPHLGRLTDDEIGAIMSVYQRMNYILDSHQTYNQAIESEVPEDREKRKEKSREEWFSSYNISTSAKNALEDLEEAREARENLSFWQYVYRNVFN